MSGRNIEIKIKRERERKREMEREGDKNGVRCIKIIQRSRSRLLKFLNTAAILFDYQVYYLFKKASVSIKTNFFTQQVQQRGHQKQNRHV